MGFSNLRHRLYFAGSLAARSRSSATKATGLTAHTLAALPLVGTSVGWLQWQVANSEVQHGNVLLTLIRDRIPGCRRWRKGLSRTGLTLASCLNSSPAYSRSSSRARPRPMVPIPQAMVKMQCAQIRDAGEEVLSSHDVTMLADGA